MFMLSLALRVHGSSSFALWIHILSAKLINSVDLFPTSA
ncbi:Uncharacterised protein [Vibrio cholerae]|nr:Uncharacterised protein [Vibrio cholerae]